MGAYNRSHQSRDTKNWEDSLPILYIVGTPIGNLEDITFRASRILSEVSLVAAEDTRVTRRLLSHLDIHPRITSFHQHNWQSKLEGVLAQLVDGDVALVTDAGMPGISDPGSELVNAAAESGFRVEVVPGPSAVTSALALSGFSGDAFHFLGFLPRRRKDRQVALQQAVTSTVPLILFESPHRMRATLADLETVLGDRQLAVCREMTKIHEEVFRGTASEALEYFSSPRGEVVLVVEGCIVQNDVRPQTVDSEGQPFDLSSRLASLRRDGVRAKDAVAQVAEITGLPKNMVYQAWIDLGARPDIRLQ